MNESRALRKFFSVSSSVPLANKKSGREKNSLKNNYFQRNRSKFYEGFDEGFFVCSVGSIGCNLSVWKLSDTVWYL